MTDDARKCSCWLPWRHQIGCELRPVRREQERTPPPPIPERGEWDTEPVGGWEPRT